VEQGKKTLGRLFQVQQETPEDPTLIEEKFQFPVDAKLIVAGRWDRVDCSDDGNIIIDYKSSEVTDQTAADRRTRESLQMLIYALAWQRLHQEPPTRVELRFVETGITGTAVFDQGDLDKAEQLVRESAKGIRSGAFNAKPQEFACKWCAYQGICPSAFKANNT